MTRSMEDNQCKDSKTYRINIVQWCSRCSFSSILVSCLLIFALQCRQPKTTAQYKKCRAEHRYRGQRKMDRSTATEIDMAIGSYRTEKLLYILGESKIPICVREYSRSLHCQVNTKGNVIREGSGRQHCSRIGLGHYPALPARLHRVTMTSIK